MGTIRTGVGLASGLNINEIVTALINAQSGQVARLQGRAQNLQAQQTGIAAFSANLVAVKTAAARLAQLSTFHSKQATSSDTRQVTVEATRSAAVGVHSVQVLNKATAQQSVSTGFANATTQKLAAGQLVIGAGRGLRNSVGLEILNGGAGVPRGSIRITDRNGGTAVVDLSSALTADDVLNAINGNAGAAVRAVLEGDRLVLVDESGGSGTLSVTEVGRGTTAAALGLAGSADGAVLTGSAVFRVNEKFRLSQLNDGLGLRLRAGNDIHIQLSDEDHTRIEVDLDGAVTLGDVVSRIRQASGAEGRLQVELVEGRIVLTDLTAGGGPLPLRVGDLAGVSAVRALGLDAAAAGQTLTGARLSAGFDSVLLRNLRGGQGITRLGLVSLQDRTGASATVDLSGAETLDDVLRAVNTASTVEGAALQLEAMLNAAGTGIVVRDRSGSTAANLVMQDVGGGTAAAELGVAVDAAVSEVKSGWLGRQTVNQATTLQAFSRRGTVDRKSFTIRDSAGGESVVTVTAETATVGDLIDRINSVTGAKVQARLSPTGDGVEIVDLAGGSGKLTIGELGGTTAADLRIKGEAATGEDGIQRLRGRTSLVIDVAETDTLTSLASKINLAGALVQAAVVDDGTSLAPSRLALTSRATGAGGAFVLDDGGLHLGFTQRTAARGAVLRVGGADGFLLTSDTNRFTGAIPGTTITAVDAGTVPASVTIRTNDDEAVNAVKNLVTSYNTARKAVGDLTKFDAEKNVRGVLQGDATVQRALERLESVLTRRFGTADARYRTLFDVGMSFDDKGLLQLDEAALREALAAEPEQVSQMFVRPETGAGAQIQKAIDGLTDLINGSLTLHALSLKSSADGLTARVGVLTQQLSLRAERLTKQFLAMEQAISTMNSQQTALTQLANLVSSSRSNSR